MFSTNKTYKAIKSGMELMEDNSPEAFLKTVRDAKLVLSNSFHGVAFSTIFRKNFYAIETKRDGKLYEDERIHSLLSTWKLEERLISMESYQDVEWENIPKVKYDETIINEKIEQSIDFLRKGIVE